MGTVHVAPMDSPRVTVVIPTYNRRHYLASAIHSVLAQTYQSFEIIVVDDGSNDGTDELLRGWSHPQLRYLRQEHRGVPAALNAGIRGARGLYVARLDSDDLWLPHMLAAEVAVLDSRPEVGVVYARGQIMDHAGQSLATTWGAALRFPGEALRSLLYDDCTCNITVLVRRVCFDRTGLYDERLAGNEDWDMWLRVAQRFQFAYLDEVVARIRLHNGNMTRRDSPSFIAVTEGRAQILDKVFAASDLPAAIYAMKPIAYRNAYIFMGFRWLDAGRLRAALRQFGRALRVGGNPLRTLARIVWVLGPRTYLQRIASGQWVLRVARWLRHRRVGRSAA